MELWAIPKRLRNTNGSGVVLDIEWFDEDPDENRDANPVLIDQILIPVPSVDRVTDEDIRSALDQRKGEVEVQIEPPSVQPRAAVRAMMGKSRKPQGPMQGGQP